MTDAERITQLAKEYQDNNPAVAVVLFTMAGALESGLEMDFANHCAKFAEEAIKALRAINN